MRSISARRCCTSWSSASRSLSLFVALADCTASSRIRCRLFVTSCSAPSVGLREGDAVVRVAHGLVQAGDLRGHALGDRETGGVVLRAVDAQARGQALQRGGQLTTGCRQIALGIQRHHVGVDDKCHLIAPENYSFLESGLANRRVALRRKPASALFVFVNGDAGGCLRGTGRQRRQSAQRLTPPAHPIKGSRTATTARFSNRRPARPAGRCTAGSAC